MSNNYGRRSRDGFTLKIRPKIFGCLEGGLGSKTALELVCACFTLVRLTKQPLKAAQGATVYLKPEVIFSLVCDFPMIIADVTLPDQAVDGPLIWVGAVPQHTAVVKAKFVL